MVWFIVIKWNHHHRRWAFIHAYIYVLPELVLHPRPSPIGKAKCIKILSTIILILLHFLYYKMLTKPGSRKPTHILNYTWYNQVVYAHCHFFQSPRKRCYVCHKFSSFLSQKNRNLLMRNRVNILTFINKAREKQRQWAVLSHMLFFMQGEC